MNGSLRPLDTIIPIKSISFMNFQIANWNYEAECFEGIADIKAQLTDTEWTILCLYAELGTYKKVGEALQVSHMTVQRFIKKLRNKVKC